MGVSFAIPIDVAMSVSQQLRTTGRVARGQLGVQVQQMGSDDARGLGLPDSTGALVADVQAGSPAEKAGIERGDVIRAVNGTAIVQSSDLPPIIGAMAPGTRVELSILRDGKRVQVPIVLSQLTDGVATNAPEPVGFEAALVYPGTSLAPNAKLERNIRLYAGPKEYQTLVRIGNNLDLVM